MLRRCSPCNRIARDTDLNLWRVPLHLGAGLKSKQARFMFPFVTMCTVRMFLPLVK